MELIFRITLFITGIINLLPFTLVFLPEKMSKSYGIDISNPNLELLLRHRAVLFGIVGGLMLYAALMKTHYYLSTAIGLMSMISFVVLYFHIGGINQELKKVMMIDVIASIILLLVAIIYFVHSKNK
ncbi:hypothetical protein AD998_13995 [bacterium 336/3]|nr:hypothetical protein AD998_13995 [bacterium 336/3]